MAIEQTRLSLHRSAFLWAAWCFAGAIGLIGGYLLARGVSTPDDSVDLVFGSILSPLFLLLAWLAALDSRVTVRVSPVEVRVRKGPLGWWRIPTDEVVYVELVLPAGGGFRRDDVSPPSAPLWPSRWRMVVWRADAFAVVANRYGLAPDPREGWGPVDLVHVVDAVRGAQGPSGRFGMPGMPTRQAIERLSVRGRWPPTPLRES